MAVGEASREATDGEVDEGGRQAEHAQHHTHIRVGPAVRHLCEYRQPVYVRLRMHTHISGSNLKPVNMPSPDKGHNMAL